MQELRPFLSEEELEIYFKTMLSLKKFNFKDARLYFSQLRQSLQR